MKKVYLVAMLYIAIVVLGLAGYVQCVVKFVRCDFSNKTPYKAEILYGIGTFTGAGIVIGWCDFGK